MEAMHFLAHIEDVVDLEYHYHSSHEHDGLTVHEHRTLDSVFEFITENEKSTNSSSHLLLDLDSKKVLHLPSDKFCFKFHEEKIDHLYHFRDRMITNFYEIMTPPPQYV